MNSIRLIVIIALILIAFNVNVFAASRMVINLSNNSFLQIRGMDPPHGIKNYSSWPGTPFIHSNCYHVHGEIKYLDPITHRELPKSVSVALPLYCKGAMTYVSKAFKTIKTDIGITASTFGRYMLPYMGVINFSWFDKAYCLMNPSECYSYQSF